MLSGDIAIGTHDNLGKIRIGAAQNNISVSWDGTLTKTSLGSFVKTGEILTNTDLVFSGGATKFEVGYDYDAHKDHIIFFYNNGNRTVISFTDNGIKCDVLEGDQWRTKWSK